MTLQCTIDQFRHKKKHANSLNGQNHTQKQTDDQNRHCDIAQRKLLLANYLAKVNKTQGSHMDLINQIKEEQEEFDAFIECNRRVSTNTTISVASCSSMTSATTLSCSSSISNHRINNAKKNSAAKTKSLDEVAIQEPIQNSSLDNMVKPSDLLTSASNSSCATNNSNCDKSKNKIDKNCKISRNDLYDYNPITNYFYYNKKVDQMQIDEKFINEDQFVKESFQKYNLKFCNVKLIDCMQTDMFKNKDLPIKLTNEIKEKLRLGQISCDNSIDKRKRVKREASEDNSKPTGRGSGRRGRKSLGMKNHYAFNPKRRNMLNKKSDPNRKSLNGSISQLKTGRKPRNRNKTPSASSNNLSDIINDVSKGDNLPIVIEIDEVNTDAESQLNNMSIRDTQQEKEDEKEKPNQGDIIDTNQIIDDTIINEEPDSDTMRPKRKRTISSNSPPRLSLSMDSDCPTTPSKIQDKLPSASKSAISTREVTSKIIYGLDNLNEISKSAEKVLRQSPRKNLFSNFKNSFFSFGNKKSQNSESELNELYDIDLNFDKENKSSTQIESRPFKRLRKHSKLDDEQSTSNSEDLPSLL